MPILFHLPSTTLVARDEYKMGNAAVIRDPEESYRVTLGAEEISDC
jgi:hypothetical protein